MLKYTVASAAILLFVSAGLLSNSPDANASRSSAPTSPALQTATDAKPAGSGGTEIPDVIEIPSSVGGVVFQHQKHVKERGMKCVDCHHQINAKKLSTPHPDYMTSSWIKCTICHNDVAKTKQTVFSCSACHQSNPKDIANETLSAKVVIHRKCWICHDTGTGKEASESCALCHSGKKSP
jgi:hypothetical protein